MDQKDKTVTSKSVKSRLCGILVVIFLAALMLCNTFYTPNGYYQMVEKKFILFRLLILGTVCVAFMIGLAHLVDLFRGKKDISVTDGKMLSVTDFFMLFFACAVVLSFLLSPFQEEALWGTRRWYMGAFTQLSAVGIYFLISRFYKGRGGVLYFLMAVSSGIFLWGILNRFSVYPLDMGSRDPWYISCMGHIDWFCGFLSVFMPIGAVLFILARERRQLLFSGIAAGIAYGAGVLSGADSGVLALGVVMLFLFFVSLQDPARFRRFLELVVLFFVVCRIPSVIAIFFPHRVNMRTTLMELLLGKMSLGGLIFALLLYALFRLRAGRERDGEWFRKYAAVRYIVIALTFAILAGYICLVWINTRNPGRIGMLSKHPELFLFNRQWGSTRGGTWRDGLAIYGSLPLRGKLFGVGSDCYAIYTYHQDELRQRIYAEWGHVRYTNAHNEYITCLVNTGIVGTFAFVGVLGAGFVRFWKKAGERPVCLIFAVCILSYFVHNQFSFATLENLPYLFMMIGLGEAFCRNCPEEGVAKRRTL